MTTLVRLQPIELGALQRLLQRPSDVARTRQLLRHKGVAALMVQCDTNGHSAGTSAHERPRRSGTDVVDDAVRQSRAARVQGLAVALAIDIDPLVQQLSPEGPELDGVPLVVVGLGAAPIDVVVAARRLGPWLARRRDDRTRWAFDGWPLCVLLPRGDVVVQVEPTVASAASQKPAAQPEACHRCPLMARCPGWPARAVDVPSAPALAVSNQADLIAEPGAAVALAADADAAAVATASDILALTPRQRAGVSAAVLLHDGGRLQRYVCRDPAFGLGGVATPGGLQRELAARGQLWLDASTKERLDDFASDLEPLRQLDDGSTVADGRWRPPRWGRAEGVAPFAAEEAWLQQRIAALRGTVIDVGAGPLRYLQVIAPAIADGTLRYVAVEPDGGALAALRAALPGATLARGVGETLPLPSRCADVVMVLRAWNHLSAPLSMLAEARRVLRPGGELLLVDNVAFGLLRDAEAAARAHAIPVDATPFEHFRNDDGAAAVAWLERAGGFSIVERQDVAPGKGNQWFVRARFDHV